jgi:TonB family protein
MWGAVSALLHLLFLTAAGPIFPMLFDEPEPWEGDPLEVVMLSPEDEELLEEPEPEELDPEGQIVDLPQPRDEETPEDADYLAEHSRVVENETMTRFRVNPEVLAPEYSREDRIEVRANEVDPVDAEEYAEGLTVGNDRFDPDRNGILSAIPFPVAVTNSQGNTAPIESSVDADILAGAPNNDLLKEERGEAVSLNTKEFKYAGYLNQIRRLVNFYWQQNLDNLPPTIRLSKSSYTTMVHVTIAADGTLDAVVVGNESGSTPLDNAVVEAFKIAGPYPPPPEGLVEADGRAYLPEMHFTVNLGQAQNHYQGIDPRAGVQFPGILKAPR